MFSDPRLPLAAASSQRVSAPSGEPAVVAVPGARSLRGIGRVAALACAMAAAAIAPSSAFAADTTKPSTPTSVVATPASGQVKLAWTRSTDNVGVAKYVVTRRLATATPGTGWSAIGESVPTAYLNSGLTNGTGYVYAVRAMDAAGNASAASNLVTAAATAPVGLTDTAIPTGASFDAPMESLLTSNFALLSESGAPVPQRTTQTIRRGTSAATTTVNAGQKRSELEAKDSGYTLRVAPGTTAWFADSIYLAPGFPTRPGVSNGWQTLMQWKDAGGTRSASPPVSLDIHDGAYTLYGGWGCPSGSKPYRVTLAPATTGVWTDFEFQIHFNTAGRGWVDSYVNGKQVGTRVVPPCGTAYPEPYAKFSMLRLGYYRDPAIATSGTVIHDEYRMGATRSNVSLYR
jgi:hypothetical protein